MSCFTCKPLTCFGWDDCDHTLVTAVPVKKKTAIKAKKTDQGCIACTIAVKRAKRTPSGVKDFLLIALIINNAIAGMAILGSIVIKKI